MTKKSHAKRYMKFPRYKRFRNPPGGTKRKFSMYKRFFFFLRRLFQLPPYFPDSLILPQKLALKNYHQLQNENTITWLGHSTFLIKLNGKTILTDPFLTDYASPIPGFGPKRFTPPGIAIHDLPPIDIIVISHNHYDHCDINAIKQLPHKNNFHIVVPLRLGKLFKNLGILHVHELNWYESWEYEGINIRALPAYHYSKRNLFTRNTSLWAAYAIKGYKKNIYFSGDTGYGSIFVELGQAYGPFDYALVSIGSYEPPKYMLAGHLSPEQAVKVGQDLRAKTLVGMHWGTIVLSDEPPLEPPLRFYHAAQLAHYNYEAIWILNIGETRVI